MIDYRKIYTSKKYVIIFSLASLIAIISFYTILLSYRISCDSSNSIIVIPKGASLTRVAEILSDKPDYGITKENLHAGISSAKNNLNIDDTN